MSDNISDALAALELLSGTTFVPTAERGDVPFATHADLSLELGWLPFPLVGKSPPPTGVTGYAGVVDAEKVRKWHFSRKAGQDNIAYRHERTIAIDVDTSGEKTGDVNLKEFTAKHGLPELPPTYSSTARGPESFGRQYFYRIPDSAARFKNQVTTDVDVCQRSHRYSVVAPSIHPDTGTRYEWYLPGSGGQTWGSATTEVPDVDDLPELPSEWLSALQSESLAELDYDLEVLGAEELLRTFAAGDPSGLVMQAIEKALTQHPGHGETYDSLYSAWRLGMEGHPGVPMLVAVAVNRHNEYLSTLDNCKRDERETRSMVADSIEKAQRAPVDEASLYRPLTALPQTAEAPDMPELPSTAPATMPVPNSLVDIELAKLDARDEAKAIQVARSAPDLQWLDIFKFMDQPSLDPLVPGFLYKDTLCRMYGAPGCGKTFVAIDIALTLAAGREKWCGLEVDNGPVVYVMAEGQAVNGDRVRAWMKHYAVEPEYLLGRFIAVPHEILLTPAAMGEFLEKISELKPSLVVLDTKNAMMVGDENSASDFAVMRRAMNAIRKASDGACVMIVDHTGYSNTDRARGTSAAKAGMDTEIEVEKNGADITVKTTRDKAAAAGEAHVGLTLKSISVDPDRQDSAFVVPALALIPTTYSNEWEGQIIPLAVEAASGTGSKLVPELARFLCWKQRGDTDSIGVTRADALKAIGKKSSDSTGQNAWSWLRDGGYIAPSEHNRTQTATGLHVWLGEMTADEFVAATA